MKHIFAADIGGTHSRFALFSVTDGDELRSVASRWLRTAEASSLGELLQQLMDEAFPRPPEKCDFAVFAVAGPVRAQRSRPPNIPWAVDLTEIRRDRGIEQCLLVNDFVAQAFACRSAIGAAVRQILPGKIDPEAALIAIGAGTGLGQAALVKGDCGRYLAVPSEGGHSSFPFESRDEFEYMAFLADRLQAPYPEADRVVSGQGLSLLHQFLTGESLSPAQVAAGLDRNSRTLRWMARFYGRVCRNYALQVLARGGVYIAGGVAAKTPGIVTHSAFEKEFRRSATMSAILNEIPVFLNSNEESGLWGAAMIGEQALQAKEAAASGGR
jgi:glucokinase